MAEPLSSAVARLTDFFSADHSEARARQTGFVHRAAKITGKLLLAVVTFGPWSEAKTTFAQRAAKVTQLGAGGEVSPEAIPQRLNSRARAFRQEMIRTAFAKLHGGPTVGEEGLFAPFPRVYSADSTGFGLPDSLKDSFPGAGGSAAQAGAKIQLVWEYTSSTVAHFALIPGNIPDNTYIDTVGGLARQGALLLFARGYCKTAALASMAAADAYVLSRLNPQVALGEAGGGGWRPLERAQGLKTAPRPLLEKALFMGARDRVAARRLATRRPEAVVNERRRRARKKAKKKGYAPSHAPLTLLAWNLFIPKVPGTVWTPETVGQASPLRWQGELIL